MLRPRLSHFLAISLAVHAVALLLVRQDAPARHWLAGPVIVRLAMPPGNPQESRPVTTKMAASTDTTERVAATGKTAPVESTPPRHRTVRAPASLPSTMVRPSATTATSEPAQRQEDTAAARTALLEQQLRDSLHAALMPHFSYPLLARRRGWEGIVCVGVRIEANGSLTRLHLVEPSPYDVLNTAAINSLSQLARLPNAGNLLQGRHVDLVLPVEYRLLEG